jgi:ABC-type uncharacterized transport system permease subunit
VRTRRIAMQFVAPLSAIVVAVFLTSLALLAIGKNPFTAFKLMGQYGVQKNSLISIVNRAIPLYISALAVAIGFKMNLFNIGVEGQYTLAALVAAAVGAAVHLPAPIHVTLILFTAMAVGALWSGIAGVLKTTRGVSEVISTIMLNLIVTSGLAAYLLNHYFEKPTSATDLTTKTHAIPASGLLPDLIHGSPEGISSVLIVAAILGILFYVVVWRTRFGYDLRATGVNPDAARASGVNPNAMVIKTMLLSGGIAGLVGMKDLFVFHAYTLDFPTGLGFAGIAVALVGRNNPGGIAIGALLFGFLERSAQILDLNNIPKEIFQIMEAIIILSVVIAYEVVRRRIQAQEVRAAAAKAQSRAPNPEEPQTVSA